MTLRGWLNLLGALNLVASLITGQQLNGLIGVLVLSVSYATRNDS